VTGQGDPSPNGVYAYAGIYGATWYYKISGVEWYLFLDQITGLWTLAQQLADDLNDQYYILTGIEGQYDPAGTYTGNPQVALTP